MKFWDSSAVVPLVLRQPTTVRVEPLLAHDPEVVLWWGTSVECASAFARAQREGALSDSGRLKALALLEHLRERALEIQPVEEVRARAVRLLAVHRLRSADALQLAAALVWCRERPRGLGFVCLDGRLMEAAALEGFKVLPYVEEVHEPEPEPYGAASP